MVILKLTSAGLNAALDAQNNGLTLRLDKIKFGSGQYAVIDEDPRTAMVNPFVTADFVGGGVEPNSHTLRFNCSFKDVQTRDVYEIGIFTDTNVLFAVASTAGEPYFKTSKTLATVFVGGLKLGTFSNSAVEIILDENGAIALQLFGAHEAHPDPHPQYAKKSEVQQQINQEVQDRTQADNDLSDRIDNLENLPNAYLNMPNGYVTLPTGQIIQWGSVNDDFDNHTFPITFPNVCYSLVGQQKAGGGTSKVYVELISKSQFRVFDGNDPTSNTEFFWMAIGR